MQNGRTVLIKKSFISTKAPHIRYNHTILFLGVEIMSQVILVNIIFYRVYIHFVLIFFLNLIFYFYDCLNTKQCE